MRNRNPLFGVVAAFIFSPGFLLAAELLLLDGQVLKGPGVSFNEEGALFIVEGEADPRKIYWNLISPEYLSNKHRELQIDYVNRYLIEARSLAPLKPERARSIVDGMRPLVAQLSEFYLQQINWEATLASLEKAQNRTVAATPRRTPPPVRTAPAPRPISEPTPSRPPLSAFTTPETQEQNPKEAQQSDGGIKKVGSPENITNLLKRSKQMLFTLLVPALILILALSLIRVIRPGRK